MSTVSEPPTPHRVAIYYAPPAGSVAWEAGSRWLGRCAYKNQALPQTVIEGIPPEDFARLSAEPRRYGWHGTLKAPFRLADGQSLDTLRAALQALCAGRAPFELGPLQVSRLGDFLALQPAQRVPALDALAADCVQQLQPLAKPLDADELARRRRAVLSPEQDKLLQAWGYPYVLHQFRFHLSLTGSLAELPQDSVARLQQAAAAHFAALPPWHVDRLSLFVEPTPGAPLRLLEQIGFAP